MDEHFTTDHNIQKHYISHPVSGLLRFNTQAVNIGDVPLGGTHPIRIQSMTTTDTMDTMATVEQSIRIIEAGADYVRITAPSANEAKNLANIKRELLNRGFRTPLIADIHFTPNAAEVAARIIEKVRVNPGNYADKKKFEQREYTDKQYSEELERIRHRFIPLVKICREYGTAMRIGANHGSLSDRIMNRYGDSPLGMVESAMEFVRICEDEGYYSIVLSMKASNPVIMVHAYRLLVKTMIDTNRNYPIHLGVTEAGEGLDARVKSAIGIGTLLEEGIGDTIRVSLAEEPECEVPVAIALAQRVQSEPKEGAIPPPSLTGILYFLNIPLQYSRRQTDPVHITGGKNAPVVIADLGKKDNITPASFFSAGYNFSQETGKWYVKEEACDYIYCGDSILDFTPPEQPGIIYNYVAWKSESNAMDGYPLLTGDEYWTAPILNSTHFVLVSHRDLQDQLLEKIQSNPRTVLVLKSVSNHPINEFREMFRLLDKAGCRAPVILKRPFHDTGTEDFRLYAATDCGGMLIDGFGDGIWLTSGSIPLHDITQLSFSILQATRTRISRTDYVACPSCGRTLFDLQETTLRIKEKTSHLKGVKIAVMGCIVNGPGEMADADYGYVGTGPGKISLYKGKEVVDRNIAASDAVNALIELIKKNGDWTEPK